MRRILAPITLCIAILCVMAFPASAQSADQSYRVGPGDVLSVTVFGEQNLSGTFPVGPDGSIGYPVLGAYPVSGQTVSEIGTGIGEAISQHIPGLTVTASVSQYAPVFVLGDVQNPGRYEYRPGMIALELIALSGGMRKVAETLENMQVQLIALQQEYADLELQVFAQEARRVRVQAELNDRDLIFAELKEDDPVKREVKQRILEGERRLFTVRKSTLASEDAALLAQQKSFEQEIETIAESIRLHDEEIGLLSEDVAATTKLVERGLTSKTNMREAERRLSATRRDALELRSFLARARQNELSLAQRRKALIETRQNEGALLLQEVDLDLARKRARQSALLDTMAQTALAGSSTNLERGQAKLSYTILRMVDGEYGEIVADERAQIKPGDILQTSVKSAVEVRQSNLEGG